VIPGSARRPVRLLNRRIPRGSGFRPGGSFPGANWSASRALINNPAEFPADASRAAPLSRELLPRCSSRQMRYLAPLLISIYAGAVKLFVTDYLTGFMRHRPSLLPQNGAFLTDAAEIYGPLDPSRRDIGHAGN